MQFLYKVFGKYELLVSLNKKYDIIGTFSQHTVLGF